MIYKLNASDYSLLTYDSNYDAFGNGGNRSYSNLGYCGEYFDNESGLIYLRARYYNPKTGRFISEDPIRDGLNWYVYCGNNPVKFVDPSGLVEVGLREYAGTYKGSEVSWNDEKKTATVTWNGKTLSVKSTSENNRNGRIYVDDSLFINAFGTGTDLVVYQDSVTENISIRASFNYSGKPAYDPVFGTVTKDFPGGISYSKAFLNGISEYWSGTFGKYSVSTYAIYNGDGIKVSFNNNLGISHATINFFGWSPSAPGTITMYVGDSRSNNGSYLYSSYMWVSAHEFGHILGVGDAYNSKNSTEITSIYNQFGTNVQEKDIEMVLKAYNSSKFQHWP